MDNIIREVLINWSEIHELTKHNSDLLLTDYKNNRKQCTERMILLGKLEWDLYALRVRLDMPEAYNVWFKARSNPPCDDCWRSNVERSNHPDCVLKLENYWEADKLLSTYAQSLKTV